MTLHDELGRLADNAPRPVPDPSVWDRGRNLRRRDRIVTSAVVLALVVIVGGLASLVVGPPRASSPADEPVPEGAIPSVIRDVPVDTDLPIETDLAIGRASAAFYSAGGTPTVIGATDGRYHLLDLPLLPQNATIGLSPSGTRLAWMSAQGVRGASSYPSLIVLDLTTGVIRAIRLERGAGLVPGPVAWSPDGSWLGWIADMPGHGSAYGAVPVGPTTSTVGGLSRLELVAAAVANDGTLAVGSQAQDVVVWPIDSMPVQLPRVAGTPGHYSPDGSLIAMVDPLIPTTTSSTLHVAKRKTWRHPFPADTFEPSTIRPAGWLDDRLQLLLVQESIDDVAEFVITTPTVNATSTWRRGIGSVDPEVAPTLSVAVDLLPDLDGTSNQQLTHDFGEPDWASERDISWLIGLGVAAAIAAFLGLRWLWRRRTHLI